MDNLDYIVNTLFWIYCKYVIEVQGDHIENWWLKKQILSHFEAGNFLNGPGKIIFIILLSFENELEIIVRR